MLWACGLKGVILEVHLFKPCPCLRPQQRHHQPEYKQGIVGSLLLLLASLLALPALLALGEELAFGLEPDPAPLDVPCGVFHRHLLLDLGLLVGLFAILLLLALLALLGVHLDLLDDGLNLVVGLLLPLLNLVSFLLDSRDFAVLLRILVLVLLLEKGDTLCQVQLDSVVHFLLRVENALESIDLLLKLGLLLLVEAILAGLGALDLALEVLNVKVLLNLSLILLSLQLGHLLRVFVLLARETVLHRFVLLGCIVDVGRELLLLLLEVLVAIRVSDLLLNLLRESHEGQVLLHFLAHGFNSLDQVSFVLPHLVLV